MYYIGDGRLENLVGGPLVRSGQWPLSDVIGTWGEILWYDMELYKLFATDLMMLLNHPTKSKEHSTFFQKLRVKGGDL
jgi:hypothetical protein